MRAEDSSVKTVLMTADTLGGVWTYSLELAAALEKKGVHVFIATMGEPLSRQQIEDAKKVKSMEVFESGFRLEWMRDPWENVRLSGEWLLRLEGYLRPDVIHLNGYAHGKLPFVAPSIIVGHSCVLSWWDAVRGGRAPREWERYRLEVEEGLNGVEAVAAPTRAMLKALHRFYDFIAPSRVIPNGREAALFRPDAKKKDYVFMAGRLWDEAKGASTLAAIAGLIDWPIYAAGPAEHQSGSTFMSGAINALGVLSPEEIAQWLSGASIFALPALYEPFGLSALEAGLSGAALVLGDIPSLREVWDGAALFVDPRDHQELKNAIDRLINDRELRGSLGQKACERAKRYTPERMAGNYIELYESAFGCEAEEEEGYKCAL